MNHWTSGQRLILFFSLCFALAMFLVQPMGRAGSYGRVSSVDYRFIFSYTGSDVTDWKRLMLQYALLAGFTWFFIKWAEPPSS
jgi:hypothetical protein